MGHPQPPTPIHCNNSTTVGIANNTVKGQRSCLMKMRFFWVADAVAQEKFDIKYHQGKKNLGDYQSEHHIGAHHTAVRSWYLHKPISVHELPYLGMLATCQQYVCDVSKCCQFWADMRVGAIKKKPTQEFCIGDHQQIVDTVVRADTVIRTYYSTYLPQGVVAIQRFPQNSATIILDNATFAITIEPVCVVLVEAIRTASLLCIPNNALGSYVVGYYF
jgi:hypothetical protein